MTHENSNRLINESSPYLQQHAYNPVDWYPWGEEAFEKAKNEDKLVLISIGYSACHWCHVMERESFEDSITAKYMNEHFVCIKVDREERPDVDQVYMTAVQLMTQRGGWPLNCFTLADGRPIFGGTYFPKDQWMNSMESLIDLQKNEMNKLLEYAERLTQGVQQSELLPKAAMSDSFKADGMNQLVTEWKQHWDRKTGGPNRAPKFPLPNNYEFLMQYGYLKNDIESLDYVKLSLKKMALGGIYDQVGGGFARYSTDTQWKVPHFEKMLYDNGQLLSLYSHAWELYREDWMRTIVEETVEFIERELTSEDNGFYSALDADSEGEEGKFYVWKKEELKEVLQDDYQLASDYFSVDRNGFWEHGNYILLLDEDARDFAASRGMAKEELDQKIRAIKATLLQERSKRVRPGLDHKILCSWNALTIKGLADAYQAFGDEKFLELAIKNAQFVRKNLMKEDGGLWRNYANGEASINAYLDDYAFLIDAYIALYQCSFDEEWLREAKQLSDYCLDHFFDEQTGMFFYTSDIDPPLIARKQEIMDNVIPSSNSAMARNLNVLGIVFDKSHYIKISSQMLQNVLDHMDYGQSFSNWGILYLDKSLPFFEVAITGSEAMQVRKELAAEYIPSALLLGAREKSTLPLLKDKFLGETTVFVCVDKACQLPVNTAQEAIKQIESYD